MCCGSLTASSFPEGTGHTQVPEGKSLLDVLGQKPTMEVVPNGVVHESFLRLRLGPRLPLENNIVVPPVCAAARMKHIS